MALNVEDISNSELRPAQVPPRDAPWDEITHFALTFDGYDALGSFEACADLAKQHNAQTLTELRACLFFEQRAWRHTGTTPDENGLAYMRDLIENIRKKVEAGDRS